MFATLKILINKVKYYYGSDSMKKKFLILILMIFVLCACEISNSKKTIIEHEFYCDEGLVMVEDHCEGKIIVDPITIDCEAGFEFNPESRRCEYRLTIPAPPDYYCDPEFELRSGKCINDATGEVRYRNVRPDCKDGSVPNGKDKCDLIDQREATFVCEEGYTRDEARVKCERVGISEIQERIIER